MTDPDHPGADPETITTIDSADAQRRAAVLIEQALQKADAEGIPDNHTLAALTDTVSAVGWKLGREALLRRIITRIEAAIDILNGKKLPPQSDTKN
jgi:hypothetical protein